MLLDTHILLYALSDDLTPRESTLLSNDTWSISGIVLWEIAKLSELGRIELDLDDSELARTLSRIQTWPLTLDICRAINTLDSTATLSMKLSPPQASSTGYLSSRETIGCADPNAYLLPCKFITPNLRRAPCSSP
jgi:PIN domain nuclease of toxin-antitoxin system